MLGKTKSAYLIYHWTNEGLQLTASIPNETHYNKQRSRFYQSLNIEFLYDENTLWIFDKTLPVIAFHLPTKSARKYNVVSFPNYIERALPDPDQFEVNFKMAIRGGQVFVVQSLVGDQFYTMNWGKEGQKFSALPILPPGARAHSVWKDKHNNLLFIFNKDDKRSGNFGAYLIDADNQMYDYSAMLEDMAKINHVSGDDFRDQAYVGTAKGAYLVQAFRKNTIDTYGDTKGLRHIGQLRKEEFYVNQQSYGIRQFKNGAFTDVPNNNCVGNDLVLRGNKQLLTDTKGMLWVKDRYNLIRFLPEESGECVQDSFGFILKYATFIDEHKVALIRSDWNQLVIYDLQLRKSVPISDGPINFQGIVHYVYFGPPNTLWVATSKGLYKVDVSNGHVKRFGDSDDFEDKRILAIHEDQKGRLWLGTVNQGIHIFDVQKEVVIQVVNEGDGLSNNVVVGMLQDEEGVIWAATYNGITLLKENGEIITVLSKKDGLSDNEFNRYAYYKADDGRLLFAGLEGLSIIDPQKVKQVLAAAEPPKIYVSRLSYFDSEKDRVVHLRNYLPREKKLVIPADKRFLSVSVGGSRYGLNSQKRYAYQLEGLDKDWTYIGNEHIIRLPNLPAGKYTLAIVAIDQYGNLSSNSIRIPIHAKEFFYKQSWFYILLALPFLIFALIWIRRLSKEKDILEKEVNKRTIQIRKDKELIEQQANELKQLDRMKSRFFANISHDFRTPLTLITGPAELVDQDDSIPKVPKLKSSLHSILQNGKKLLNLVDEIMDLTKLESNQIKLYEEKLGLKPWCDSIYSSYQAAAKQKRIEFLLDYALDNNYAFLTDPRRLEKILNNLLSNAFKFTTENGAINFNVRLKQQKIYFIVEDSGRGIPPDDLPHVFDRYFQSKQENLTKTTGSGIGLSLSMELAKLMGGDIEVDSEFGKGSIFTLILPAEEGSISTKVITTPDYILEPTSSDTPQELPPFQEPNSKILIVEDNLEVQAFLKTLLQEEYQVITKNDGQEAWDFLREHKDSLPIELVLSDINMPNMDGYELLKAIKKEEKLQQLPVIMLTAKIKEKSKLKALRMGVDDYLTKPFSPTELRLRIRNLLANYHQRISYQKEIKKSSIQFDTPAPADQSWLAELEKHTQEAINKKINLTVSNLAHAMAISERQLARKIKLHTGMTIGKYIQEVKLQKARHLFENRVYNTVSEVCYEVGFNSTSHFAKVFSEYFGKKPSAYL